METSGKAQTTHISDGRPCPSDFIPRDWMRGGHSQTILAAYLLRQNRLPKPEKRLFSVEADVQILAQCHWQTDRTSRTTLVIVHGLEGSSKSQYIIGTANKAWALGMNVVRMNMRNCGGSARLSRTLYNSSMSSDVAGVVRSLVEDDALPSIAVAGFSMGGNMVLKMAGEWGANPPEQVKAIIGISPAMDLSLSVDVLHKLENRPYEYAFLLGLYLSYKRKVRLYPEVYSKYPLFSIRSLRELDDKITARYGGFAGAEDYYYRASSARVVDKITVPTLIIHSNDDPFIKLSTETRAKILANPHIRYIETEHGGHCAFLGPAIGGFDGRWSEKKIVEFVQEFARTA